ncbi:hypothetical protein GOV10_05970 [Candidatus Woesearchaeota archaeon]|nr:hypothetical protein [Candidatus Woesearchaeota archaeon]
MKFLLVFSILLVVACTRIAPLDPIEDARNQLMPLFEQGIVPEENIGVYSIDKERLEQLETFFEIGDIDCELEVREYQDYSLEDKCLYARALIADGEVVCILTDNRFVPESLIVDWPLGGGSWNFEEEKASLSWAKFGSPTSLTLTSEMCPAPIEVTDLTQKPIPFSFVGCEFSKYCAAEVYELKLKYRATDEQEEIYEGELRLIKRK